MGIRLRYSLAGALPALALALVLVVVRKMPFLSAWLFGINLCTFFLYAVDKLNSKSEGRKERVPEFSLLFLALIGGSPAALATMLLLRHKIRKGGFLLLFFLTVAVQAAAVYFLRDQIPWREWLRV